MPAPRYTSFAVFGAGLIGAPIAKELHARGASVLVLARPGCCLDTVKRNLSSGIHVFEVDYNDSLAVTELLREHMVKVVVSTVSAAEVALQNQVATAAQAAGVELFAPSEFGVVTEGVCSPNRDEISTIGLWGMSEILHELTVPKYCAAYLKTIHLPFARFYVSVSALQLERKILTRVADKPGGVLHGNYSRSDGIER